jgi:hypothetical protein
MLKHHLQCDLSPFSHGRHRRHGNDNPRKAPMTKVAAALLASLSLGVILAHALDAYRTA